MTAIDHAFSQFPILTTERLRLRQTRPADREMLYAIHSDQETMKYVGHIYHETIDETENLLHLHRVRYSERQAITWAITLKDDDDQLIGTCSFHRFGSGFRRAETGYILNSAYWRQGITYEAMQAVLKYGFEELDLHRIEALIDDANDGSKALLLKLGFTYEGCLRERFLLNDQFEDEFYYGLLKDEWRG